MDEELLKALTPEQFGSWRQSPVGQIFFQYLQDYAAALTREHVAEWMSVGIKDQTRDLEMRGRVMTLTEVATGGLGMIKRFYSMESGDDEGRKTDSDGTDSV